MSSVYSCIFGWQELLGIHFLTFHNIAGQGPFSHVFEEQFLPSVNPENEWRVKQLIFKNDYIKYR